MIYTSYYAKLKEVPNPIAISIKVPTWYVGKYNPKLAPSWDLVLAWKKKLITEEQYIEKYFSELENKGVTLETIKNEIPDGSTILCWETPEAFCHRHIIAAMLEEVGVKTEEWKRYDSITDKFNQINKEKNRIKLLIESSLDKYGKFLMITEDAGIERLTWEEIENSL